MYRLLSCLLVLTQFAGAQQLQKITINYPTRTGQSWPLYIAKEGGYYQKYGLDVSLVFGVHPAGIAMVVSGAVARPLETGLGIAIVLVGVPVYYAWCALGRRRAAA